MFLKCYSVVLLLLPNTRITILQQSHNNLVAVMLRHSEYAYAFVFFLLFFLIYKHLPEGAHLSLKSLHRCSFLLCCCGKGGQSSGQSSIHPPTQHEWTLILGVLMSRPKFRQFPQRLGVWKARVIGIWQILLPIWCVNCMTQLFSWICA